MLARALLVLLAGVAFGALAWYALQQAARAPSPPASEATIPGGRPGVDPRGGGPRNASESVGGAADGTMPSTPQGRAPARAPADSAPVAPGAAVTLGIPVAGVSADALTDTFSDRRGGERAHEALDIMAPAGTPVLAVADGHVEKLFESERGGLTVYQFEPDGRYAYYYAHLDAYAPGLHEGQALRRGQVIGRVGSSGNADPAAPHLHFAVFELGPGREWWRGTPVNPYPLLGGR